MLTVRLLGFFRLFRKRNLHTDKGVPGQAGGFAAVTGCTTSEPLRFISAAFISMFLAVALLIIPAVPGALAAKSVEEEENGQPYIGRDSAGNRVFGTDDKSEGGFSRDSATGDRIFKTAPPKRQDDQSGYNGQIWVSPEVTPGRPPAQRPRTAK